MSRTLQERLAAKIDMELFGCWIWKGATYTQGYGQIWWGGRKARAHRVAYELLVGPIPEGLELDHLCRVRNCINPAHLEPVTHRENTLRGNTITAREAASTTCPQGHPYDRVDTKGFRKCRRCIAEQERRRRERRRAAVAGGEE